ncbi:hypothetical protein ACHQM5_001406 [Ranunculus cassubicifolius]
MDFSKLTEDQKQQLTALHQQFQQHQQEQQQQQIQQQQQQQQVVQSYEQSQQQQVVQTYDPSTQQTYEQQPQIYDQSYYQYQSYYQQPDYTNPYNDPAAQIQPPGVSNASSVAAESAPANSYYPGAEQQQVPSGLNPAAAAAVAALSQLTQFAGNMGAAERAMAGVQERQWPGYGPPMQMQMPPPQYMGGPYGGYHQGPYHQGHMVGRPPYRGGGKRGGSPFRGGGGRGNGGQRPPRGRGRGGKGRNPQRATSSNPEMLQTGQPASEQGDGNASALAHEGVPGSATGARSSKAASSKRQPQIAWCELCRVDCTSVEILEQHKNGKKHKKNLQRFEELQKAENPVPMTVTLTNPAPTPTVDSALLPDSELPIKQESLSEPNPEVVTAQPDIIEEGVTNNTEAPTDANNNDVVEPELENGEHNEVSGSKRKLDRFDSRTRGMNKRARGGRGGKKGRTFDRQSRAVEPAKPKEVIPIICDLCNVKCDTAAVFQTHLGGKKHIAKLRRFQGHQALFGPLGLQALYPPNPNTQPIFIPQAHHHQPTMYAPDGSFNHQGVPSYGQPPHVNQNDMPLQFNGQQGNESGPETVAPVLDYGISTSYSENVGFSRADTKVDAGETG